MPLSTRFLFPYAPAVSLVYVNRHCPSARWIVASIVYAINVFEVQEICPGFPWSAPLTGRTEACRHQSSSRSLGTRISKSLTSGTHCNLRRVWAGGHRAQLILSASACLQSMSPHYLCQC